MKGVPLISKNLDDTDCSMLLDKITGRINSWLIGYQKNSPLREECSFFVICF
jgi:hypothetical protein